VSEAAGLARRFYLLHWLQTYSRADFTRDILGAAIVSFMFLPQSLAYAFLAGLPPQVGLYASIVPLMGYALFGTSRVLAVGPVAVISLMTASALEPLAVAGTPEYVGLTLALCLLSGAVLVIMGMFRLGFLSNLLSHPVISGFVTASTIIIALSQVKSILGVKAQGNTLLELAPELIKHAPGFNAPTLIIGVSAILFLLAVRLYLRDFLVARGVDAHAAAMIARAGPLFSAAIFTVVSFFMNLPALGVETVGELPRGLPTLTIPPFDYASWRALLLPALFMSIIGFVESVSVAKTFAAKRRERVLPDNELLGLGTANIVAAFCGGMPVSGGFSRSVVNSDAGVRTPIASIFTGIGIAIVILFLVPVIAHVPLAVLAATIIVAVLSLIDFKILAQTWAYSKSDFTAVLATIVITLLEGVEIGVAVGVVLSILMYLYRTSRPHVAVVGLVPQTQHFRNVKRHEVITSPHVLNVRVDESLYFANASYLEEALTDLMLQNPDAKHLVLICSAINTIDTSALETLESLNHRLADMGVTFHLSEVKGPVMDRLRRSDFLNELTGRVFLSQFHAATELDPALLRRAWQAEATPEGNGT
jgi:SulP family sulfate permease